MKIDISSLIAFNCVELVNDKKWLIVEKITVQVGVLWGSCLFQYYKSSRIVLGIIDRSVG